MEFGPTHATGLKLGEPGLDGRPRSAITFLRCGRCAERAPERVPDSLGCAYLRGGDVNVVLPDRADADLRNFAESWTTTYDPRAKLR